MSEKYNFLENAVIRTPTAKKRYPRVFLIDGLDRLGKSTLIQGIKDKRGFHQVIHFGKPEKLDFYDRCSYPYQLDSFKNMMQLVNGGGKQIYDRSHLGEVVYANIYRGYDGSYVYDLEREANLDVHPSIRLILLIEDFSVSRHFISDGESFDDSKRQEEQYLFVDAFNRSIIQDKRMICVTAPDGQFKSKEQILAEALA